MATNNNTFSEFLEFRLEEVVGSNIKKYVKASGMTTEELSYRTNLSIPTINRLKAGQHLSVRGICAIAEGLGVDPCEFFREE